MLRGFVDVIAEPRFYTYAFAGAFSFAGLFVYVTGSPIIFLDGFHVDPRSYGLIFAGLAAGCIGAAQLNIWLTRRFSGDAIFRVAVTGQTLVMIVTFIGTALGWYGLTANIALLLLYLMFCGPSFPNAAAHGAGAVHQECRQRIGAFRLHPDGRRRARLDRRRAAARHDEPADLRGDGGDGRDRAGYSDGQSKANRVCGRSDARSAATLRADIDLVADPRPDMGEGLHVLLRAVDQIRDRGAVIGIHALEARRELNCFSPH